MQPPDARHFPLRGSDAAALALLCGVYSARLAVAGGAIANPDAYYHYACAELYAQSGWVPDFVWLPFTSLAPGFPNAYLLLHLALLPFAATLPPATGIPLATVVLNLVLVGSAMAVVRRRGIAAAGVQVALLALASNLFLFWSVTIRGLLLFSIFLVWIVDALQCGAWRRAFLLTWLSVYAYVGAPILIAIAAVYTAVPWVRDGRRELLPLASVGAGLAAGLLVNPFWPEHWTYLASELRNAFARPEQIVAGVTLGGSWSRRDAGSVLVQNGAYFLAWGVLLVRQRVLTRRVPTATVVGSVLCLGVLGTALYAGNHLLGLFHVLSLVFLPQLAAALGPWRRATVVSAGAVATAASLFALWLVFAEGVRPGPPLPADYAAAARFLESHTRPGERVLANWDEFPGLFAHTRRNTYMAGLNPAFLLERSPRLFEGYVALFQGRIVDPENYFAEVDARIALVRAGPVRPFESGFARQLEESPRFEELPVSTPRFRAFRLRASPAPP